MAKIEIANPLPNGMRYTSTSRAAFYCQRRLAEMHGGKLHFFAAVQELRLYESEYEKKRRRENEERDEFNRNRGGVIYWNGEDKRPWVMWPPGCRRS